MSTTKRFIATVAIFAFMISPFAHSEIAKSTSPGVTTYGVTDPGGGIGN